MKARPPVFDSRGARASSRAVGRGAAGHGARGIVGALQHAARLRASGVRRSAEEMAGRCGVHPGRREGGPLGGGLAACLRAVAADPGDADSGESTRPGRAGRPRRPVVACTRPRVRWPSLRRRQAMSFTHTRAFRTPATSSGTCAICRGAYRAGEPLFCIDGRFVHVQCPPLGPGIAKVVPLRRARSS